MLGKKRASACMPHALCGLSERIAAFTATDNGNEKEEEEEDGSAPLDWSAFNMALADPPA